MGRAETTAKPARARSNAAGKRRAEALIRSAAILFGERGFEGATMTEIAARANSAIGSLYQFFPTKNAIAAAVSNQMTRAIIGRIGAIAKATPPGDVDALAERLLDCFCGLHAEMPAYATLSERPPPGSAALRERIVDAVQDALAHVAPQLEADRLRTTAVAVLALCKAACSLTAEGGGESETDALKDLRHVVRDYLRRSVALPRRAITPPR